METASAHSPPGPPGVPFSTPVVPFHPVPPINVDLHDINALSKMLANNEPIETQLFAQPTQQGMGLALDGQRGELGVERSGEEMTLSDEDSVAAVRT